MALGAGEWLVANINMRGFYRVNYDTENWNRLLNKLSTRHQVRRHHVVVTLHCSCLCF